MSSRIYTKKPQKFKIYERENPLIQALNSIEKKRKLGLFIFLIGIGIILFAFLSQIIVLNLGEGTIINPVPLSVLAENISSQNRTIDEKNPLGKYIPNNKTTDTYNGNFYISFPSLNLKNIKVKANVDSTNEKEYEDILNSSTAHFKGTALPGEGGNTFIYGHSSVTWFHDIYPYSYLGVFTALFDLKIGDKISVTFKNKPYTYIVEGIQTINAKDFSQIQSITGINTITLMTCSPPGIGDKRLIIKAIEV